MSLQTSMFCKKCGTKLGWTWTRLMLWNAWWNLSDILLEVLLFDCILLYPFRGQLRHVTIHSGQVGSIKAEPIGSCSNPSLFQAWSTDTRLGYYSGIRFCKYPRKEANTENVSLLYDDVNIFHAWRDPKYPLCRQI